MTVKRVALGEWTPDMPATIGTESTGLNDAKNVYPNNVGYSPFPTPVDITKPATEDLNSVFVGKDGDLVQMFAGGQNDLWKTMPLSFRLGPDGEITIVNLAPVSKEGGYNTSDDARHFESFGRQILACKSNNKIQVWNMTSSANFADLDEAPSAKCMSVVRDFVVAGNMDSGDKPNLLKWSDLNNEENWTPGPQSQADSQYLADGGAILNITGGEIGMIFMEGAVYRMSYVGSPLFFQFDKISSIGCFAGKSVIEDNGTSYYLAKDGFYKTDGSQVMPIGSNKVDEWFLGTADLLDLSTMSTTVNPLHKLVVWNYRDKFGARQNLIYHTESDRWSRTTSDVTCVGNLATLGTDLDSLGFLFPDLDTEVPAPLDDRMYMGGKYIFAGAKDMKIIAFTGPCVDPLLETLDLEGNNNSVVTMVRPIVDNGAANISIASRQALDDNILFGPVSEPYENRNNVRSGGRYHRVRLEPVGEGWSTAVAFDMTVTDSGIR